MPRAPAPTAAYAGRSLVRPANESKRWRAHVEKVTDDRRGHRAVRHPPFDRAALDQSRPMTAHEAKAKHGARQVVEEDEVAATGGLEAATPNGSSCVRRDAQALSGGEALVGPSQSG